MRTFVTVVGARPNFMKAAPLHRAFQAYAEHIRHLIVHTGQHYDTNMSDVFFTELELPEPDLYLGVGSGSHAEQTARIMTAFERVLLEMHPDLVIVVGDVNSTLACAVTAAKLMIPIAHVEAGLRSFDRSMPEEINRIVTDILSDYLFVTEKAGMINLAREGVPADKVHFVGDVMIDSLVRYRERARATRVLESFGLSPRGYALVTLHRPSNVDEPDRLRRVLAVFEALENETRIVFPVHPRTRTRMDESGLGKRFGTLPHVTLCEPLGYLQFLALMDDAALVMTDSGGIQEETSFLGVPCLTLRENTERPVTIELGTNRLCGLDVDCIVSLAREILAGKVKPHTLPPLWDGHAAERIAAVLAAAFGVPRAGTN
ncbi:MAG: UDP-N-acetylglucosamine 2-epimerase (non-hydrolyzing) [Bacteroidota bacterium]|nr:UDP-N-acetylglucosamine 2-epimerase (non-hydrolyzing) [Bacteroidota bacterium]